MSVEKERRTAGGKRVSIQALVEVGAGQAGSAAFEAESVDVTTTGMHLRTAYLPEVGEPLLCRFEAGGREVVVQGEVVWRNEEACGGDFGVRFSEIDSESLQALREIAGEPSGAPPAPGGDDDQPGAAVQRGTRVRLHIEGLGSPMKARVRDATSAEVLVGSNLEFLKVGRPLDLENVDASASRGARIERVGIEVDQATRVPQLVVALRYLDAPPEARAAGDEAPEGAVCKRVDATQSTVGAEGTGAPESADDDDEVIDFKSGKATMVWNKIKQIGPVLADVGGKAKDVMRRAVDRARARSEAQGARDADAPRRTTSPPPAGGLRAWGRKIVRDEADASAPKGSKLAKLPKRAGLVGFVVLLVGLVAFALARRSSHAPAATAAAADNAAANAAPATPETAGGAAPSGAVVANLPLFGPTPMTTNDPAAQPAAQPAAAPTPPPGDVVAAAAPAAGESADADESDGAGKSGGGASDDADDKKGSSSKTGSKTGGKSFVHGKVRSPVAVGLKMSGPIKSIRGMPTATGFTVHIAGAQAKDSAASLAHHDSRIASAKLATKGNGADLTVQFKDGVPAYAVRANGSTLQVLIGRDGDKKSAKSDKHHGSKPKHRAKH
jgi:hypothetical protein